MIKRYGLPLALTLGLSAMAAAALALSIPIDDWKIAGPFGGTATSIGLDPQKPTTILAGGRNSLLFESQDAGANWVMLNFPQRTLGEVTSILIDPKDSKHYLVGMTAAFNAGLFESRDGGDTWAPVKDLRDIGVRALAASASDPARFVAGTLEGVMLSNDSGKNWTRISDPQNFEMHGITAVAIDPKDPDIIYAGTPHLPWKTTDGGKTWQSIHQGMIDDSDVFSIYIDPVAPSDIFASACSGIYSSTNHGDLWHKLMGIPNTSRRTHVVRQDPARPGTIYAGTTLGLFKSINSGTNWKLLNDSQVNSMVFDPSNPGTMYLAMEYNGIGKSDDSGEVIRPANQGFVDRSISAVTSSGDRLFAAESQNGATSALFVSADRGRSWSQIQDTRGLAGVHLHTLAAMPSENRILFAANAHEIFKSVDAGQTWRALPIKLVITPPTPAEPAAKTKVRANVRTARRGKYSSRARSYKPRPIIRTLSLSAIGGLYPLKSGTKDLLLAATDRGLLKTEDMGDHWTLVNLPAATAVDALYATPNCGGRLIVRAATGLYESKDYGTHWEPLQFPLGMSDINDLAVPTDPTGSILVATRSGVYSSPDGTKWYRNLAGLPIATFSSVVYSGADNKLAYAAEYGQVYQTKDGGASWSRLPTAFPSLRIRQLWMPDQASSRLYAVTSDVGILFRN